MTADAKPMGSVQKALALAALGLSVFPVGVEWDGNAGKYRKRPLTARGFKDATDSAVLIRHWWTQHADALVGVAHGNGIACLDFDGYAHPEAAALADELSLTHDGPQYVTASGGMHMIFRALAGKRTKSATPGVEMLDGASGFFVWWGDVPAKLEIQDAPQELLTQLVGSKAEAPTKAKAAPEPNVARSAEPGAAVLAEVRRALRTLDPNDYGDWIKGGMLVEHELGNISEWDSWSRTSDKYKGVADLEQHWSSFGRSSTPITLGSFRRESISTRDDFDDVTAGATDDPFDVSKKADPLPVYGFGHYKRQPWPSWFIREVLPVAEINMLYGPSGAGKSFVALDMALAIARGVPWGLKKHRTRQCDVFWFAAEAAGSMKPRATAYEMEHGIDLEATVPNFSIVEGCQLGDDDYVARMIATVRAGRDAVGRLFTDKNPLVVIDTLAAANDGRDENSSEMNDLLESCRRIWRETGASVLLIHHSGKDSDKGARGWSGLRAAVQGELRLLNDDGTRPLAVTKNRDGTEGELSLVTMRGHLVGKDADGEEVRSAAVRYVAPDASAAGGFSGDGAKWAPVVVRVFDELHAATPGVPVSRAAILKKALDAPELVELAEKKASAEALVNKGIRCAIRVGRMHAAVGGFLSGAAPDGFDDLTTSEDDSGE